MNSRGIARRRFLAAGTSLVLVGAKCAHGAQLPPRHTGLGCTEIEPFLGSEALEQSIEKATDERVADARRNVRRMEEGGAAQYLGFRPGSDPQPARRAIVSGAGAAAMPRKPLQQGAAPVNLLRTPFAAIPQAAQANLHVPRLALRRGKFWNPERPLTISFVGRERAPASLLRHIKDAVDEWQRHIEMKLNLDANRNAGPSSDISIGFRFQGFFSALGTDSATRAFRNQYGQQSLNIEPNLPNEDYFAVALHELGHALAAIHEHQQPATAIQWNTTEVNRFYSGPPNKWSQRDIEEQIYSKYRQEQVNASDYDPASIMHYPIDPRFLLPASKHLARKPNTQLSRLDGTFIGTAYGSPRRTVDGPEDPDQPDRPDTTTDPSSLDVRELRLNETRAAELTKYGERHLYRIVVPASGSGRRYAIETVENNPSINMTLELYSNRSLTSRLARESHGGRRVLNARITRELSAGTYYVVARHANRPGKGRYEISFRAE